MATKIYIGNNEIAGGGGASGNIPDSLSDLTNDLVIYLTKAQYDALVENETVDESKMYVITDLADTDDLADLATNADIQSAIAGLNAELEDTADAYYAELSADLESLKSDITSAKNTAVSAVQSQQTTSVNAVSSAQSTATNAVNSAKNTAVSAVQTQQTTSVDAVEAAGTQALSDIDDAVDAMPKLAVMTEAAYNALDSVDSNTIYFITVLENSQSGNE